VGSRGCRKRTARFRTIRDPRGPAPVRTVGHVGGQVAFQAGVPGECQLDKEVGNQVGREGSRAEILGDNQPDTPAVVHAGQTADRILDRIGGPFEDPFVDQNRCLRAPSPDCLGRGGPRHSMGMRVVVAMPAEAPTAGGNLRGLELPPSWVLESH